jgi:hypothetical protein
MSGRRDFLPDWRVVHINAFGASLFHIRICGHLSSDPTHKRISSVPGPQSYLRLELQDLPGDRYMNCAPAAVHPIGYRRD